MPAGNLDRRVTVLRRTSIADDGGGNERGGFAPAFARAAEWRPLATMRLAEQVAAGVVEDRIEGTYVLRDDPDTRTITAADRLVDGPNDDAAFGEGREFAIVSAGLSDRSGYRAIIVSRTMGS